MSARFLVPSCPCLVGMGKKNFVDCFVSLNPRREWFRRLSWNQQAVESLILHKNNISPPTSSCYCVFAVLINFHLLIAEMSIACPHSRLAHTYFVSGSSFHLIKNLCGHNYYEWWYTGENSQLCFTTYWTMSFSFARCSLNESKRFY